MITIGGCMFQYDDAKRTDQSRPVARRARSGRNRRRYPRRLAQIAFTEAFDERRRIARAVVPSDLRGGLAPSDLSTVVVHGVACLVRE
jgi:hypothetical protein